MNNEFAIKIHGDDNVAVGIVKILAGTDVFGVVAKEDIPVGHKIALVDIGNGADVVKYGAPIGAATAAISAGCHVHTHNLRTKLSG
ncbi:MAG: UxaA family hydrolase, partial [Defluviitaleaceae bacterium]|nr:UxaA family hydrolase [Defluviitaleaceae bacterium]